MQLKPVVGEAGHAIGRLLGTFDYSCAAVVGLNRYDVGEYGCVISLLDALLSKDMEADQRLHIIRDEYRIADSEIKREVRLMEALGTLIALRALREGFEKGVAEGVAKSETSSLLKSITSLTKTLGFSRDQAMDALEVPKEDRPRYNLLLDVKTD